MLTFQDNFWGEGNRGFTVLLNRLKYGRSSTEALLTFLATRIEIEEEYVRKLQRLSTFTFPREEEFHGIRGADAETHNLLPAEVLGAMQQLPLQTGELCARHTTLVESLKQRLLWPLEHSLKEQRVVKKQHKQEMLRILKGREAAQEAVTKLKDRYYSRCKERALLVEADVATLKGRALEKHEQRLRKVKEAEQEADSEYRSATYRLAELHNQWQGRMGVSAREFQKLEETRLELFKQALLEYSAISHCHMQEQAVAYAVLQERAAQCDRVVELEEFIRKYATGSTIPTPPSYYADFPQESVEDSLRRLSLRATQSPRRLYASSSSSSSLSPLPTSPSGSEGGSGGLLSPSPPSSSYGSAASSIRAVSVGGLARPAASPLSCTMDSGSVATAGSLFFGSGGSSIRRPGSAVSGFRRGSIASVSSNTSFSDRSAGSATSSIIFRVRTQYAYQGQESDELSFREDQIINVLSTAEDPWWYGQLERTGQKGLFPSNYVDRI